MSTIQNSTFPECFFTREKSNEGITFNLITPDGKETDYTITILGADSDAFRKAKAEAERKAMKAAMNKDRTALEKMATEAPAELVVALVKSWTLPAPCTPENVAAFLKEAPYIADQIDRLSSERSLFFKKGSPSSTNTPDGNLN